MMNSRTLIRMYLHLKSVDCQTKLDDLPYYLGEHAKQVILAGNSPFYVFRTFTCTLMGYPVGLLGGYDVWEDALRRIGEEWETDKKNAESEGKRWDRTASLHRYIVYIRESDVFVGVGPRNEFYDVKPANFLRTMAGLEAPACFA